MGMVAAEAVVTEAESADLASALADATSAPAFAPVTALAGTAADAWMSTETGLTGAADDNEYGGRHFVRNGDS